jgi:hypothetical protein
MGPWISDGRASFLLTGDHCGLSMRPMPKKIGCQSVENALGRHPGLTVIQCKAYRIGSDPLPLFSSNLALFEIYLFDKSQILMKSSSRRGKGFFLMSGSIWTKSSVDTECAE